MKDTRKKRTRFKLKKVSNRNRLTVFKSNNHLYAQVIDDLKGVTLASASSLDKKIITNESDRKKIAAIVGKVPGQVVKPAGELVELQHKTFTLEAIAP